jgi:hypothetical protein
MDVSSGAIARTAKRRTVAFCMIALVVAACGDAFTTAAPDGGLPGGGSDASFDVQVSDDGEGKDADHPRDAESTKDGTGDDVSSIDDSGPVMSDGGGGGGSGDATALCAKICPIGFDCVAGACVDRAAEHFGAATLTDNWSYGSFMSFGSSPFSAYGASWTTNGIVFASQAKNVLTSSVFHSITSAAYAGMSLPAGTLGLYPGATTNIDSVVRWTCPAAGTYAIAATFTGLGTTPPTTVGVSVNIGPANEIGKTIDGMTPSTSYSNPDQLMAVGDTIDFYVNFVTLSDDEQGGTSLDARITAN